MDCFNGFYWVRVRYDILQAAFKKLLLRDKLKGALLAGGRGRFICTCLVLKLSSQFQCAYLKKTWNENLHCASVLSLFDGNFFQKVTAHIWAVEHGIVGFCVIGISAVQEQVFTQE